MAIKDSRRIFERVYNGMTALAGEGTLSERLNSVFVIIVPLQRDDFPEAMRDNFISIQDGIAAAQKSGATDEDRKRLSENYLTLYTQAARLEGSRQDSVGGLSPD